MTLNQPSYVARAKITEPELIKALPLTVGEIAQHAAAHQNTVSSKMAGSPGQYLKVHQVFTAVSIASGNAFSRSQFVLYEDPSDNQFKVDSALDACRVFHDLRTVLQQLSLTEKSMGDAADVPTHVVKNMLKGLPVRQEAVDAVFTVAHDKLRLDKSDHIFR